MARLRDESRAATVDDLASDLAAPPSQVRAALERLAAAHALVLRPGTHQIWMAHPFAGVPTDFQVTIGGRKWFANCAWDGLAILALLGDGALETHSPGDDDLLRFEAAAGVVHGPGIIHFLVPPRRFWDDIAFT